MINRVKGTYPIPNFLLEYLPGNKGHFQSRRQDTEDFKAILDEEMAKLDEGGEAGNNNRNPLA